VAGWQWLGGSGWVAVAGGGSGWVAVAGWQWLGGSGWVAVDVAVAWVLRVAVAVLTLAVAVLTLAVAVQSWIFGSRKKKSFLKKKKKKITFSLISLPKICEPC
jgi:hypothetical protein